MGPTLLGIMVFKGKHVGVPAVIAACPAGEGMFHADGQRIVLSPLMQQAVNSASLWR
jgi:hypothetical protein